jgi:hypothetical protein
MHHLLEERQHRAHQRLSRQPRLVLVVDDQHPRPQERLAGQPFEHLHPRLALAENARRAVRHPQDAPDAELRPERIEVVRRRVGNLRV